MKSRFALLASLIVVGAVSLHAWGADKTPAHALTVEGGTGGGTHAAKEKVTVTADAPAAGKFFDRWTGPQGLKLPKDELSGFVLEMPDADVMLVAHYGEIASSKLIRVACVGDSITEIVGYPKALGELLPKDRYEVRNFGVSSATALFESPKPYYKEPAFRAAKDYKPNVVVVLLGTNDTRKANPNTYQHIADFVSNYKQIVKELAGVETSPRVYLALPTPIYGEGNWGLNEENLQAGVLPGIKQVAAELKLPVIDVHAALSDHPEYFNDRVHPNGEGPKVLAATVYKAITDKGAPAPTK
jgi:lysophospholipase L1-like esterase